RRSTGFDADEARRQLLKEWQNVPALESTANDYITRRVNSVDLENRLGDVETNCRDRLHVWLLRIVGALNSTHIHGTSVPVEEAVHSIISRHQRHFTSGLSALAVLRSANEQVSSGFAPRDRQAGFCDAIERELAHAPLRPPGIFYR